MKRPNKGEYYYFDKCAPKKEKRGCYGDCVECFWSDSLRYDRYLEENNLEKEDIYPNMTDRPPNCLMMGRGRVYGLDGEVKEVSSLNKCDLCGKLLEQ